MFNGIRSQLKEFNSVWFWGDASASAVASRGKKKTYVSPCSTASPAIGACCVADWQQSPFIPVTDTILTLSVSEGYI